MNQNVLSQMISNLEKEMSLPEFSQEMQPWDIIITMCDRLPPHEQKIAEFFAKLDEAQEILNEMQCEMV